MRTNHQLDSLPLALTMGDASGIGPEIVAKVLAKGGERVVVFGSHVVMQDIVRRLGLTWRCDASMHRMRLSFRTAGN